MTEPEDWPRVRVTVFEGSRDEFSIIVPVAPEAPAEVVEYVVRDAAKQAVAKLEEMS
jgi:hypothetical protein